MAIEAHITSSEDLDATAQWTLTDGVLDGHDDLSLAASSSLRYTVRLEPSTLSMISLSSIAHTVGLALSHNFLGRVSVMHALPQSLLRQGESRKTMFQG